MKKADQLIAKNRERWHTARINEAELNTVIHQLGVSERIAKILIAVAKGKKLRDKRELQKQRDWNKQKARLMKEQN